MSLLKEFKEFAVRGNVMDMAIGIIIGGAFGKIVSSFVNDVIMPPIGLILSGTDFTQLSIVIKNAIGDSPAVTIKYGLFINTIIDFIIIAFVIFAVVKVLNKLKKNEEISKVAEPPAPSEEILLLREIRDSLKK